MTNSIYTPYRSATKPLEETISIRRWIGFGLIKVISIICGLIAVAFAIKFATGEHALFEVQREYPYMPAWKMGHLFGELVVAPFAMGVTFGLLTFKLWSTADRIKTPRSWQTNSANLQIFRKITNWILGSVLFLFGALTILELINTLLGALAILFTINPSFNNNPFRFDYSHELLFWLPAVIALMFLILALATWKLKNWLLSGRQTAAR